MHRTALNVRSDRGTSGSPADNTLRLGSHLRDSGADFQVFAQAASRVDLLLFDALDAPAPARVVPMSSDGRARGGGAYWHVHVPGIAKGQLYGYRVDRDATTDSDRVLLDPYARGVALPDGPYRLAASTAGRNDALAPKSVVCADDDFDWQDDRLPRVPRSRTVIYELHVGLFTGHPSSGVAAERRGTYLGVIDKIDYLRDLGVTTVELMPCFQFDTWQAPPQRENVWGYDPMSFFAPHVGFATRSDPQVARDEFRTMVRALHAAGLEVILDVVYNHTAEGKIDGPTYGWRGLAASNYYTFDEDGGQADFTGCGNTVQSGDAVTRRMIVDSLRHWALDMHVDGFRFDLASVLSRGHGGAVLDAPPVLHDIDTDPALQHVKLYAEAWDAVGLYQLGDFPGETFDQWNGKFRDDVRGFFRRDHGTTARLVQRLVGSPDVFDGDHHDAARSVNFVTCHDGFTLHDVVSYSRKHNLRNGEDNRDGSDHEICWNLGVEGATDDSQLDARRLRLIRSMLAVELLAVGTPLLAMGDEMRRTQLGNNNPWCLGDAEMQLDWTLLERNADLVRTVRRLLHLRRELPFFHASDGVSLRDHLDSVGLRWHGLELDAPDWQPHSHSLAYGVETGGMQLHVLVSAWTEPLTFELPAKSSTHGAWRRVVDTALPAPDDVLDPATAPQHAQGHYVAEPESVVLLVRDAMSDDDDV